MRHGQRQNPLQLHRVRRHQPQMVGQMPALRGLEHLGGGGIGTRWCCQKPLRPPRRFGTGFAGHRALRHRSPRRGAHAHRPRRTRPRLGRRHGRRRGGADWRRPGHWQIHLVVASLGRFAAHRPKHLVRHRRRVWRAGRAAGASLGAGPQPGAGAGRNPAGKNHLHPASAVAAHRCHRLHPNGVFRPTHQCAGVCRAGARVCRPPHPLGQGQRHRHCVGRPCHQRGRFGRSAGAGTHGRHGAVL